MIKDERQRIILREINLHNKVLTADLSVLLQVSHDTINRDLKELIDSEQVVKVHGGAMSKFFATPFLKDTDVYAKAEKQIIAGKALKLIKNDMVILTEGGTTMIELAKAIPDSLRVTFFTISPQVAITLSDHSNIDVITIGGKLNKNANLHIGPSVINDLSAIKADLCFLGANAFSVQDGLTDVDWDIVHVKKAIIRSAKKVAVLSISEKLNTAQRIKICGLEEIDYLITELPQDHQILSAYKSPGLELI